MDSMRGLLSGSDSYDDGAIEAPPAIGVDERRMQVRAYNFWASLLYDRAYPSVEDLDIENIEDFGPHSVLLDFTAGIEDPAIVFLGDQLRGESELAEDVQYISQVASRSVLSRLTDHYLQIIANRAPIGFEAEFDNDRGVTIMYRGILLPFSSDDDTIDFIMGVINWKEAVSKPQADELVLEVEQALRAPPPPLSAPVPLWADGPDSEHIDDEPAPGFGSLDDGHGAEIGDFGITQEHDSAEVQTPILDAEPGEDAALADWLAVARETADRAIAADSRSRGALYQAVGRAWDFAVAAEAQPEEFATLLDDAGLTVQDRAPMTPVVKLVFGSTYDKTRLAEYALVLGHARESGLRRGQLAAYLESYSGGLKALVRDERARRKPATLAHDDTARNEALLDILRSARPLAILEQSVSDEFVIMVARRVDAGHIAVIGQVDSDPAMLGKLLRKVKLPA